MRRFLMFLVLLPSLAAASPTDDLLARLQQLHSLSGSFQQTVIDHGGNRLQQASGTMTVARGNRFRWHTLKPFEQLVISDGQQIWVYDVGLEQVVIKPLRADLGNTPALLFGGNPAAVAKAFAITERDRDGDRITYRLRPKDKDPLFDTLDVTFAGAMPVSMRLEDALGQQTVVDFHDLTLNGTPPSSLFHLDPPKGVDVIRQQ